MRRRADRPLRRMRGVSSHYDEALPAPPERVYPPPGCPPGCAGAYPPYPPYPAYPQSLYPGAWAGMPAYGLSPWGPPAWAGGLPPWVMFQNVGCCRPC